MEGLKKRNNNNNNEEAAALMDDYNTDDLPYKGKVFLARRKKPDSWKMIGFQVFLVLSLIIIISLKTSIIFYSSQGVFDYIRFWTGLLLVLSF